MVYFGEMIPKWPEFRLVNYYNLPRILGYFSTDQPHLVADFDDSNLYKQLFLGKLSKIGHDVDFECLISLLDFGIIIWVCPEIEYTQEQCLGKIITLGYTEHEYTV